ncbi:MAG: hypothetical protein ACFFAH_17010 [Promethearchaeota archaeon]
MVIREAGLLFKNVDLVTTRYIKKSNIEIYQIVRNELLLSLRNLIEEAFLTDIVEYLGGKKYVIAFIEEKIIISDNYEPELLIAYCIVNNRRRIDRYINKIIIPLLKKIIYEFRTKYDKIDLTEKTQYQDFKTQIDEILGDETKTIDQKLLDDLF